jgi:hypothetical protein
VAHVDDRSLAVEDRAVSTALGYVLSLAVASMVVVGLLAAAGGFVGDQRERAVRTEFDVLGQRIAADLAAVDRLARSGDDATVTVESELPRTVAGTQYQVRVVGDPSGATVVLRSSRPDVTVRVPVTNRTAIAPGNVTGGPLELAYNGTADEVVVSGA